MRRFHSIVLLLLLSAFCAPRAYALEYEGAGLRSCSEFIQDSQKYSPSEEEFYFSWAEGYMSGVNVAKLNDEHAFKLMPADQQKLYLRNFCNKNLTDKFYKAVYALYLTLYPKVDRLNIETK